MEKFAKIIEKIKNQEKINPPDNMINQVMAGVQEVEKGLLYKFNRILFQPLELSPDAAGLLSGKIITPVQCAFLLFTIGFFYLVMGLFVIWGMKDVLTQSNINLWLRVQPYMAVISGVFIISMAFFVRKKPQTINFARYAIIAHTIFIILNALVLEFLFVYPAALVFTLWFTALAVFAGVLLISSMQNFIMSGSVAIRREFAQNV